MTTLWVFGDSFADKTTSTNTWVDQVAATLNCNPKFLAVGGSGVSYTYEQFNRYREQIQDNDILIFALTEITRHWFDRNNISETIWVIMDRQDESTKAIEHYLKYLDNDAVDKEHLNNFLYNLHYLTKKKNTITIILPSFDYMSQLLNERKDKFPLFRIADRSLFQVSTEEYNGMFDKQNIVNSGYDTRVCHLMDANHTILANKIVNNVKSNEPIALNGFVTIGSTLV